MKVVEEAEQPVLHLLHVGHVGQEGVLDDRSCLALALVLVRFSSNTRLRSGFLFDPPPALVLLAGVGPHVVAGAHVPSPGGGAVLPARAAERSRCAGGGPGDLSL